MGLAELQPQSSAASASWKSAAQGTIMLPSTSPPQAACTASVSLRSQDSKTQGTTVRTCLCQVFWDWNDFEAGLVKHTAGKQGDARVERAATSTAQPHPCSAKPSTKRVAPATASATARMSTVEKLLDYLTIMWTGGASSFHSRSSSSAADDPRLPYQQMDTFAAAFGPMPLGAAITSAPLAAAYSRC